MRILHTMLRVNDLAESSPAERIVTILPPTLVTEPPSANAPPIVSAALFPTAAAVDIPSASKA